MEAGREWKRMEQEKVKKKGKIEEEGKLKRQ